MLAVRHQLQPTGDGLYISQRPCHTLEIDSTQPADRQSRKRITDVEPSKQIQADTGFSPWARNLETGSAGIHLGVGCTNHRLPVKAAGHHIRLDLSVIKQLTPPWIVDVDDD